jgi:predicted alpha/beta hydrolase family esterase
MRTRDLRATVLFVPGLRDHVADHWQTLLAAELAGARTVPPLSEDKLSRAARVAALDRSLAQIEGPVILAAHSAGCLTLAHWAQTHRRDGIAALLATPADIEVPLPAGYPTPDELRAGGWLPIPRVRLGFPAIVAASLNDPLGDYGRIAGLARDWGARLATVGAVGHLNPAAGFGPWPDGRALIAELDLTLAGVASAAQA